MKTQLDRDEETGLKKIRNFLRARTAYDVLPLSFRLIELDVALTVKESLQILVNCGELGCSVLGGGLSHSLEREMLTKGTRNRLRTAMGFRDIYIRWSLDGERLSECGAVLQPPHGQAEGCGQPAAKRPERYHQPNVPILFRSYLILSPTEVERVLNVKAPETISTSPEAILYDALRKQLVSRARRIPLVSYDSDSQRTMVTSVITQYRILKFIAMNVRDYHLLRKPLSMLKIGTYDNIVRCSLDSTVLDVIDEMVTRNISSVPVVTLDGMSAISPRSRPPITCGPR